MSGREGQAAFAAAVAAAPTKDELRRLVRARRASLTREEQILSDERVARQVMGLACWETAGLVYAYVSINCEVDTRRLVEAALEGGRRVALPRVIGARKLAWHEVTTLEGLIESRWHIPEPDPARCPEVPAAGDAHSVALVPGLAFDGRGMRIGYGGGFYDTFLVTFRGTSVGLCREGLLVDVLPHTEPHDLPVDIVVCG